MVLRHSLAALLSMTLGFQTVLAQPTGQKNNSRAKEIAQKYADQVAAEERNFEAALELMKNNLIDLRSNLQEARKSSALLNYNVALGVAAGTVYAANAVFFYRASKVPARAASATRYGADAAQLLILAANISTLFGNSKEVVEGKVGLDQAIETLETLMGESASHEERNAISNLIAGINEVKNANTPRETLLTHKRLLAAFSSFLLAGAALNAPQNGVAKTKKDVAVQASFVLSAAVVTILSGIDEHDEKVLQEKLDKVIIAIETTQASLRK